MRCDLGVEPRIITAMVMGIVLSVAVICALWIVGTTTQIVVEYFCRPLDSNMVTIEVIPRREGN